MVENVENLVNLALMDRNNLELVAVLAVLASKVRTARGNMVTISHRSVRYVLSRIVEKRRLTSYGRVIHVLHELADAGLIRVYRKNARGIIYCVTRGDLLWDMLEKYSLPEAVRAVCRIIGTCRGSS